MLSDLVIRPGKADDAEAVSTLLRITWHDTYDPIMGAEGVDEISARWHAPERLKGELAGKGQFLVADLSGNLAGHSFAAPVAGGTVKLHRLYVLPDAQGRGVGVELLKKVRSYSRGLTIQLEVQQENTGAVGFYKRHGFLITGESAHCGGDSDVPSFIMERKGE